MDARSWVVDDGGGGLFLEVKGKEEDGAGDRGHGGG